ncbi:MAG: AMP-dependent synthetase/ligase [Terriglobia bacterium]
MQPHQAQDFETLNQLFLKACERHSKTDAILSKQDGRYRKISSVEALRQTAALALALERVGAVSGARVALLSENCTEWAFTDYATLGLGVINVPIYPTLPANDVGYILRDCGACGIVVSTEAQLAKILEIKSSLPELRFILIMEPGEGTSKAEAHAWRTFLDEQLTLTPAPEAEFRRRALEARPEDAATIIYTSGTTGRPKGVVLTHANIISNVKACMPLFRFGRSDRVLSFLPLSHILERMLDYFAFWSGSTIAYAESMERLPQNILEVRPTIMAVVPRVLEKVHAKILDAVQQGPPLRRKLFYWAIRTGWEQASSNLAGRPASPLLRLKWMLADALVARKIRKRLGGALRFLISGAAPLSQELAEFFFAAGLPVYEGYGLTETSPVISVNCPGAVKLGTVGRVIPGVEVKLGEESGGPEAPAGSEILVRGPNVSRGYNNGETVFANGWFHTGDLGRLDPEGFLSITGRKKNLFKTSGGKFVAPEKLEGLFQGHPFVAQLVVIGDRRHFVMALVVPNFDRLESYARENELRCETHEDLVSHDGIRAFMQQQVDEACRGLAPFERIRQIALLPREFGIDTGELSPTQKVRRFVVEERYRHVIEEIYRRPAPQNPTPFSHSR